MDAKKFTAGKDFSTSKGFPVGRTVIDLETADFGSKDFTEDNGVIKTVNQVTLMVAGKKETYNVPLSVMKKVQEAVEKRAAGVEVNRQGTTKTDTKYVTYVLDQAGKIIN